MRGHNYYYNGKIMTTIPKNCHCNLLLSASFTAQNLINMKRDGISQKSIHVPVDLIKLHFIN